MDYDAVELCHEGGVVEDGLVDPGEVGASLGLHCFRPHVHHGVVQLSRACARENVAPITYGVLHVPVSRGIDLVDTGPAFTPCHYVMGGEVRFATYRFPHYIF